MGKDARFIARGFRADPSLKAITSLEGLTKSYIHAQKAMGKDKISVPDKHATPDDWQGIFTKLGNPEKLEDYKMDLPDAAIDDALLNKVKIAAHAKGILPWQLEAVIKEFNGAVTEFCYLKGD